MVEWFSGVLSGAAVGNEIGSMYKDMDRSQNVGHFFCLMDVSAFMDIDVFTKRTDEAIDKIKACRRREGMEEIFVPGERSNRRLQENQKRGIRIDDPTLAELNALCKEFKITFNLNPVGEPVIPGKPGRAV
ncbi:MAG: Ldh family oxidoreductase [Phycisphaeraceae bacterium]|nr:Ldh family oxidoreductase [Phycisphaeraceae bacterium]